MATKNLTDMTDRSRQSRGYQDRDGYWTNKGYDRMTQTDWNRFSKAVESMVDAGKDRDHNNDE
jgi:hypothetical protein